MSTNRYFWFALLMFLYPGIVDLLNGKSYQWIKFLSGYALMLELPLLLYLYFLFNSLLKPGRSTALIAAYPIILAYVFYDLHYSMFGREIQLAELSELPELLDVLTPRMRWLAAALILLPTVLFLARVDFRHLARRIPLALPLALIAATVLTQPVKLVHALSATGDIKAWSAKENARNNGRLVMTLYEESQRRQIRQTLELLRDRAAYRTDFEQLRGRLAESVRERRNVHLIVMESFLDPKLLKAQYSQDPMHEAFKPFYAGAGLSRSSVFGGGTAQAEFELLCGVPAFGEFSAIEFNAFSGAQAYCLPALLEGLGYRAVASNGYKPGFFNTIPAYRGMGFDEMYFPQEYAPSKQTYLSAGNTEKERFMFDGRLFEQNFDFVFADDEPSDRPLFNYVLGIYGHFPHTIDESQRPSIISVESGNTDGMLSRYVNQYYYRTQALGEYLKKLTTVDPDSLIIVVSDHLPPLQSGKNSYNQRSYLDNRPEAYYYNRVFVVDRGKPQPIADLRHYEVPSLIFNLLSGGQFCEHTECGFVTGERTVSREDRHADYVRLMAHATE